MSLAVHPNDAATFWDREWRLQHLYKIRTEDRGLRTFNMDVRPIQRVLYEKAKARDHRGIRIINLKSRKLGVTTFWGLYYLDDTLVTPNTVSCILAHRMQDVQKIFRGVKTAYNHMPEGVELSGGRTWYKPRANYDNKNELVFDEINSMIYVALESRGDTNQNLHISEAAHIPNAEERLAASLESVPNRELGSNITIETTANGVGGWFHDTWQDSVAGLTEFDPAFFAWFMVPKNKLTPPKDFAMQPDEEDLVARVAETYGVLLEPAQVFWWRQKKASQRRYMNQEHPTFADDAFLFSGSMAFDEVAIKRIVPKDPVRALRNGTRIFVEPKPGRRYIVACDPAEGVGGDASVVEVVDAVTLEQVSEYRSKSIKPGDLGEKILPEIGRLYNEAVIAIERNNHGHTVIDRIKGKYARLFMTSVFDEKAQKRKKKIGWLTNAHTRDLMLDELEELVADGIVKVNSAILKGEMMTFIVTDKGRREAKSGKHDDTVIAMAIAVKVARTPKSSFEVYEIN